MSSQTRVPDAAEQSVRPVDMVLAGVLVVLAAVLAVMNVGSHDPTVRIDSHSWLQVPVFVASVVGVLWWRRHLIGAILAASGLMLVHVLAFGHLVRCGAGLPLVFVLAFLCGCAARPRQERLTALALTVVLAALVLVWDTAAGPTILPVIVVIEAGLYGIGQVVAHRAQLSRELSRRNEELRVLRDERAALEVSDDRAQLSVRLETLLDQRLRLLEEAAEAGKAAAGEGRTAADPAFGAAGGSGAGRSGAADSGAAVQALLVGLEDQSRRTLEQMREIIGQLRGGEVALAPVPSVAHLNAWLARTGRVGSRLQVTGDPRVLPPSLELSAYRIVEHLVTALADEPATPVRVGLSFTDEALEIVVAGAVPNGTDLRGAVARARERALLHAGTLDLKVARGRARVLAHLPVLDGG